MELLLSIHIQFSQPGHFLPTHFVGETHPPTPREGRGGREKRNFFGIYQLVNSSVVYDYAKDDPTPLFIIFLL